METQPHDAPPAKVPAFSLGAVIAQQEIEDAGLWVPIQPGGEVFLRYLGTDAWREKVERAEKLWRKMNPKRKPNEDIPRTALLQILNEQCVGNVLADWRGIQVDAGLRAQYAPLLDLGPEIDNADGSARVIEIPFTRRNALWFLVHIRDFRDQIFRLSNSQEVFAASELEEEASFSVGSSAGAPTAGA